MKTAMKRALATAALATVAFAGAATTASAATARPQGCGPNGCTYEYWNHYLSMEDCDNAGAGLEGLGIASDYYCVRDTSDPTHGPWYDLYVA